MVTVGKVKVAGELSTTVVSQGQLWEVELVLVQVVGQIVKRW